MKRREIIRAAKMMVIYHGPSNVLEFGEELFDNNTNRDMPEWPHKEEIIAEAVIQAERIYDFLGM